MKKSPQDRLIDRQKRVTEQLAKVPTLGLLPLVQISLSKMAPSQLRLARRMPLEDLAKIELMHKELYGF